MAERAPANLQGTAIRLLHSTAHGSFQIECMHDIPKGSVS